MDDIPEFSDLTVARPPNGAARRQRKPKFTLIPFGSIVPTADLDYLVKGLLPTGGLIVTWGPPKCGKSFWMFDLVMHIALDWKYRERRVQQGAVVYLALEGSIGFRRRVEAFRRHYDVTEADFYLITDRIDLIMDSKRLIDEIREQLAPGVPILVVIDTLNRSLAGSESKDEDMARYVRAADAVREAFGCAVAIVHHCGVDDSRPRGHTSLTGAADAQIAVKRDASDNIVATLQWMKDGPEGAVIVSRLESVELGTDADGDPITSCIVVPVDAQPNKSTNEPKLTPNQKTMFSILHDAGPGGLTTTEWNDLTRAAGIGTARKATLHDIRSWLKARGLVRDHCDRWTVS
jgi:AAA domain